MTIRRSLIQMLSRYDIRPAIPRMLTPGERRCLYETYHMPARLAAAHEQLRTMLERLDRSSATSLKPPRNLLAAENAAVKLFNFMLNRLMDREQWEPAKELLGTMYQREYYPYATMTLDTLVERERAAPIPGDVLGVAFRVPTERRAEFTDACFGIDALVKLMNALVKNERWDVVTDFLQVAKDTYRSGARVALARVITNWHRNDVPNDIFERALDTDCIVAVRTWANIDLFWAE